MWKEGTSQVHVAGLYHNIQATLAALSFRPPRLFDAANNPHTFVCLGLDALRGSVPPRFNVSIQAYALGERFNDPLPSLSALASYPSHRVNFDVEVRRMNRPPLFFLDRPSFSVTQLQEDVILDGISVADPDAREEDLFEVFLEVEGPGGVAFNGEQGRQIRQQLTLRQMNQLLQRLTFAARQGGGLMSFEMLRRLDQIPAPSKLYEVLVESPRSLRTPTGSGSAASPCGSATWGTMAGRLDYG